MTAELDEQLESIRNKMGPDTAMICGRAQTSTDVILDGHIGGKAGKIIRATARTGEPIFVVRARDLLSVFSVEAYVAACERYLAKDMDMQEALVDALNEFQLWQRQHPDLVRFPD